MLHVLFPYLFIAWATADYVNYAMAPVGALRQGKEGNIDSPGRTLLSAEALYSPHTLSVPIDHFQNSSRYEPHSRDFFDLRYFFDPQYYQEGGPVIVLESGETQAENRLPYLEKGIVNGLARATHGIGVVLEHRYYGKSIPVSNLTTESMRFLTTEQSIADAAYFAQHVKFPGFENKTLTAPAVPWIAYGGSYAGAFVAFLRTTYPDIFWGAIASSAVTQATWDYWYYYEPVRTYGPPDCISQTAQLTKIVDDILLSGNSTMTTILKSLFGLQDLEYDDDFVNTITYGIGTWQSLNWDPLVGSHEFTAYCAQITSSVPLYNLERATEIPGLIAQVSPVVSTNTIAAMVNYMGYIASRIPRIATGAGESIASFFSNRNISFYAQTSIENGSWRPWPWQYCTEWGFLQTGSGVPNDILPLISRLINIEYVSLICKYAFNRTGPADIDMINNYGGAKISYDRLAFVDGQWDPWIGATPHAPWLSPRNDSLENPFILMEGAVHHWDENGVGDQIILGLPPPEVSDAQSDLVNAVLLWMREWSHDGTVTTQSQSLPITDGSRSQLQNSPGGGSSGNFSQNPQVQPAKSVEMNG